MKLIDTTPITSSAGYPGLAHNASVLVGLDFMQQAALDNAAALAQGIASNTAAATILVGCVYNSGAGTISAGWVYYGGEIFYVPSTTLSGSGTYINASWTANPTDTGGNKTVLSDSSSVSMHNQRTIAFSKSNSSNIGNLPDFGNWITTQVSQNLVNITSLLSSVSTINAAITALQVAPQKMQFSDYPTVGVNTLSASPNFATLIRVSDSANYQLKTPNDGIYRHWLLIFKSTLQPSDGNASSYGTYRIFDGTNSYDTQFAGNINTADITSGLYPTQFHPLVLSAVTSGAFAGGVPPDTTFTIQGYYAGADPGLRNSQFLMIEIK